MSIRVFYSWQSDLDSKLNRNFQLDCLKQAIKRLNTDLKLETPIREDHDTKDVLGTPDIAATIFEKINSSDIFIGDISFVTTSDKRSFSNPNVLIELGFALKSLGDSRVINIMNTAFGEPKDLPFDLAHKRWPLTYDLSKENIEHKPQVKKALTQSLYNIIKSYVNQPKRKGLEFETSSGKLRHEENLRKEITSYVSKIRQSNLSRAIIIRDVDRNDLYPEVDETESGISPWFKVEVAQNYHRGIQVILNVIYLIEGADGNYQVTSHEEENRIKAFLIGEIPYSHIDVINWDGDEYYLAPHIYCHFEGQQEQPYERLIYAKEVDMGNGHTHFSEIVEADKVKP